MANRNFANSRIYTGHVMPVLIDGSAVIGAAGAVGTVKGPYVKSVTHMGTGLYQIKLADNYSRYFSGSAAFVSPLSGSNVDPHTVTPGTPCVITVVGSTDWATAGVPAGVTPAPGVGLALAAQPAAGTGRVQTVGASGIMSVEAIGNQNLTLDPSSPNQGAIILFQCLNTSGAPTDPAAGSVLGFTCYLSNSSIQIQGE
jgi:hypothetical protein